MGGAFSTRPPPSGSSPRRDRHSPPRLPLPLHLLDCVALFSALHTARRTAAFFGVLTLHSHAEPDMECLKGPVRTLQVSLLLAMPSPKRR
ncbi:hypothetical protein AcV7_002561 [Taiwanofungus camphoratus]|nr:hypothetical protein AcV7_002561 [Antrodia cinnamomea]